MRTKTLRTPVILDNSRNNSGNSNEQQIDKKSINVVDEMYDISERNSISF